MTCNDLEPCETLSSACALVLKMSVTELDKFKPQTVAEKIAQGYAFRALRGDDESFNLLTATADTFFVDQSFEDDLSKALREVAETMVSDYRAEHAETV